MLGEMCLKHESKLATPPELVDAVAEFGSEIKTPANAGVHRMRQPPTSRVVAC